MLIFLFYILGNFLDFIVKYLFLISKKSHLFSECTFYDCIFFLVLWIIISLVISESSEINYMFLKLSAFCLNSMASVLFVLCSDLFSHASDVPHFRKSQLSVRINE